MSVPSGWSKKTLEQVSKLIDCKHRTPKYVKQGVPLVSPGTIKWGALDLNIPVKQVTIEEYESLMDHCVVDIGDLVLSRNQSVGVAAFIDSDSPFVLGQDTVLLKPIESYPSFLFYNLQSDTTQRTIFKLAGGSTFSRINLGDIRKIKSLYPPLPEQRKIAKILTTWDKAITTTEKLITTSKQQKKSLMQQLLTGKKRLLNPETGKPFVGEWEEVELSSLCNVRRGASPRPIKDTKWFADEGRGWVRIADATKQRGQHLTKTSQYLSVLGVEKSVKVDPGDLIMSICGTIGVPKILDMKACIHDGFVVFRECGSSLNLRYLYHHLLFITDRLRATGQPGTQKNLNTSIVGNIQYPKLSYYEQQKIAQVLTTADKEIETLETKLTHLQDEKKALMQQLLTGKRRVKIEETGVNQQEQVTEA